MTISSSSRWTALCAVLGAFACNQGDPDTRGLGPPTSTGAPCGTVSENEVLSIACPLGKVIDSVDFASYGAPGGTCGFFAEGSCHAANSSTIVARACIGKASCTLTATDATFGNPCPGVAKKLSVQVSCRGGTNDGGNNGGSSGSGGSGGSNGGSGSSGAAGRSDDGGGSGGQGGRPEDGSAGGSSGNGGGRTDGGSVVDARTEGGRDASTSDASMDGGRTDASTTDAAGPDASPPAPDGGPTGGVSRPTWNTGKGFFAVGRTIYDANGVEFRIRGVNHNHWWTGVNDSAIPYMAAANANAVRVVFGVDAGANTTDLRKGVVDKYIANQIVPVVEYHNATCKEDPASLNAAVDMWVGPDKAWLQSLERYVILNVTNEWGPNSAVWRDTYISAVTRLRQEGVKNLIMIDAGGACGQLAQSIESYGKAIFDADPEKNVIFSVHMYGFWVDPGNTTAGSWDGRQPYDIDKELATLNGLGVPIVVGEFSWNGFSDVTYTTRAAVAAYEKNGVGWLAWMWNNPSDNRVNMANSNVYSSSSDLTEFGKLIIEDPTLGLKANARRATIF